MSFKIPNGHYIIYTDGSEQGFINTIFLYWTFLLHQREQSSFPTFIKRVINSIKEGVGDRRKDDAIDYINLYKKNITICLDIDNGVIACGYCYKEYFTKHNHGRYTEIRYDNFINKYDLDILFPLYSFYETT